MKISTNYSGLRMFIAGLCILFASQASAKYFSHPSSSANDRMVNVVYAPAADQFLFADNTSPVTLGILHIPAPSFSVILFCGGRDSSGGDTTGGGNNDTLDGDHGHHDGNFGDGDDDSNRGNNDTTNWWTDTTHWGNDTVDCGHHHADNDDSTNVNDTATHTLFGGGHQSIIVKSHANQALVTLTFTNNTKSSITISNIALANGKYFAITSGAPSFFNPIRVAAGAKINLKIAFTAADHNVHTDQLTVQSNSPQLLNTISLQGQQVQAIALVTNSLPAGVSILMAPNPMTSSLKVALTNVNNASAQVFDIEGKQIISAPINAGEWIWNGQTSDGSALVAGTYLIRVNGVSSDGTPFLTVQKIILAR